MNKIKIFMMTLIIIIVSGVFCISYGVVRRSTEDKSEYAEMWEKLDSYAEGTSTFNPATCELTEAMKWIDWFEIQDFEEDELEKYYKEECIKILGQLKKNPNILLAGNSTQLMNKIAKIGEYVTDTWTLSEEQQETLGVEQAKKNEEALETIDEKENNKPITDTTPKPINKGTDEKTVTSINPTDYMPSASPDNADKLADIGNTIIGVVQIIGSIVSVAVLAILGIKYMVGSAEERAEYKKSMKPYIIGAVMVFSITNILVIILKIARGLF